nr:D-alanyl-D-alanine carboxypeptidase [Galbitalea soli]
MTRKQIYRRRRITVFGGMAVVLALAFYLPLTLLAPLTSVDAVPVSEQQLTSAPAVLDLPGYGASGIGAVGYPGLFARSGSKVAQPMASISKVITTLVVLSKKPLTATSNGPRITFGAADVAIAAQYLAMNGKVDPVSVGETMTEKQVIQVMLIDSANNYAWSLANWAFGSEQAFLTAANKWLKAHGMTHTTMLDPCGLDPGNASTPDDLVAIGKLVVANPALTPIVASKRATVAGIGTMHNTNGLLGVSGINGIKTGTLLSAGASLLFSARLQVGSEVVTLVGVILDGPDHPTIDAQVKKLISSVRAGFHTVVLAAAGQRFGSFRTVWGATAYAVAPRTTSVVVWSDTPVSSSVHLNPVSVAAKGSKVGAASYVVKGKRILVTLVLDRAIEDPGPGWRLSHPGELF